MTLTEIEQLQARIIWMTDKEFEEWLKKYSEDAYEEGRQDSDRDSSWEDGYNEGYQDGKEENE